MNWCWEWWVVLVVLRQTPMFNDSTTNQIAMRGCSCCCCYCYCGVWGLSFTFWFISLHSSSPFSLALFFLWTIVYSLSLALSHTHTHTHHYILFVLLICSFRNFRVRICARQPFTSNTRHVYLFIPFLIHNKAIVCANGFVHFVVVSASSLKTKNRKREKSVWTAFYLYTVCLSRHLTLSNLFN